MTGQHEIGAPLCDTGLHCHSCGVDEDGPAYIGCGECGHLYRRASDLRRAYRRGARRVYGRGMWWWRFRANFRRARDIFWCQECSHDF